MHEFRVSEARKRPKAGEDGNAAMGYSLQEILQDSNIENRLGDGKLSAGIDLALEAGDFVIKVRSSGIDSDADMKSSRFRQPPSSDIDSSVQRADDIRQTDRIDIKNSSGIRIVPKLGRVSGYDQDIPYPLSIDAKKGSDCMPKRFLSRQV